MPEVSARRCYDECGSAGCAYPTNCAAVPVIYRDLDAAALAEAKARGRRAGIEETTQKLKTAIAEETRMDAILLAAGEMTAQERRTVSAVAKRIAWGLNRALATAAPAETEERS